MMKYEYISKDVTALMSETNRQFTASEMATIVWHLGIGLDKRHRLLNEISQEVDDPTLQQQIGERITYDQRAIALYKTAGVGLCYHLHCKSDGIWSSHGCFDTFDVAEKHAKDHADYRIEKHRILDEDEHSTVAVRMNPRLWNEPHAKNIVINGTGQPLSEAEFNAFGSILFFHSNEIPVEETYRVEDWGAERFEEKYIDVPNPFDCGDIVCMIGNETTLGVVETSAAEWEAYKQRILDQALPVDWSDASITVRFLNANDGFAHSHVCPIFLEKCEPSKDDPRWVLLNIASILLNRKHPERYFNRTVATLQPVYTHRRDVL